MTDPADHSARTREIEARLLTWGTGCGPSGREDLSYLLSLVAEKDQRIKELEAAGNEAARNHLSRVKSSEPLSAEDYRRLGIEAYDILQRVLLPAPETVETQG